MKDLGEKPKFSVMRKIRVPPQAQATSIDFLKGFVKRTLRKQVLEYIRYTQRKAITVPFTPSHAEMQLYNGITAVLEREDSYSLPKRQRHFTGLILRKLLASSTHAVNNTLITIKHRLEILRDHQVDDTDFISER